MSAKENQRRVRGFMIQSVPPTLHVQSCDMKASRLKLFSSGPSVLRDVLLAKYVSCEHPGKPIRVACAGKLTAQFSGVSSRQFRDGLENRWDARRRANGAPATGELLVRATCRPLPHVGHRACEGSRAQVR